MIRLRFRRGESKGVSEARKAREQAATDLASTQERLASERRDIVQPLMAQRRRWITHNHVTEELIRQLREAGGTR